MATRNAVFCVVSFLMTVLIGVGAETAAYQHPPVHFPDGKYLDWVNSFERGYKTEQEIVVMKTRLEQAEQFFRQNQYEEALYKYEAAIDCARRHPEITLNPEIFVRAAACQLLFSNFKRVLELSRMGEEATKRFQGSFSIPASFFEGQAKAFAYFGELEKARQMQELSESIDSAYSSMPN